MSKLQFNILFYFICFVLIAYPLFLLMSGTAGWFFADPSHPQPFILNIIIPFVLGSTLLISRAAYVMYKGVKKGIADDFQPGKEREKKLLLLLALIGVVAVVFLWAVK